MPAGIVWWEPHSMSTRTRRAKVTLSCVVLVSAILTGGAISSGMVAQQPAAEDALPLDEGSSQQVRIEARRLEDGRTEFALRLHGTGDSWGDLIVPGRRFFPTEAPTGRWLVSGPITLRPAPEEPGEPEMLLRVRITARRLADGRIEYGLQRRSEGGRWGERLLPARRFFPTTAEVGRWLVSSPVTVVAPAFEAFAAGDGGRSGETLLAASFRRTCAVQPEGGVTCWGHEGTRERLSASILEDVLAVSIGDSTGGRFHTCALHGDGTVSCWGPGGHGELGLGDAMERLRPATVPGIRDAVAVAAGADHTCAAHRDGRVTCWGDGSRGQLGDGAAESSLVPRVVPGLREVATVAAGPHASCAVHSDGAVSCWGWGATTEADHLSPQRIGGLRDAVSVALGWGQVCAVLAGGEVSCWVFADAVRPRVVAGISDAVAVSVGDRSVCAVHRNGGVSCWGANNAAGQLGAGTNEPGTVPTRLPGIDRAVAVTVSTPSRAGEGHACAMEADGSVWCWGANRFGQVGDGAFEPRPVPVRVRDFEGFDLLELPADTTEFLRIWIDRVVQEREAEFPWLRAAWDHVRHRTQFVEDIEFGGYTRAFCRGRGLFQVCMSDRVAVRSLTLGTVIHELAHAYDLTPDLVAPRAWGAVQLYFAVTHPDCYTKEGFGAGVELLADTMEHLVVPYAWLGYYHPPVELTDEVFDSPDCAGLTGEPTEEAEAVVRAGLAGEVPEWYTENITSGAELWAAIRSAPSVRILLNLQDEFGGFCDLDWLRYPLAIDDLPPADDNQFRDGGC